VPLEYLRPIDSDAGTECRICASATCRMLSKPLLSPPRIVLTQRDTLVTRPIFALDRYRLSRMCTGRDICHSAERRRRHFRDLFVLRRQEDDGIVVARD
jgi:hypothetical protein